MEEFSMPQSILQIVSEKGFDGLREIMQMLFNEAMKMERENYLHASPYQRTDLRTDHANGFKPRTINTLQGEIQLSIPQTRNGGFYPSCLENRDTQRACDQCCYGGNVHSRCCDPRGHGNLGKDVRS